METIGQEVRTKHIDIDNIDIVILLIEFSEDRMHSLKCFMHLDPRF